MFNYSTTRHKRGSMSLTSNPSFPNNIGVFEAGNNVVGDSEGEFQAVLTSFLENEDTLLRIRSKWNW